MLEKYVQCTLAFKAGNVDQADVNTRHQSVLFVLCSSLLHIASHPSAVSVKRLLFTCVKYFSSMARRIRVPDIRLRDKMTSFMGIRICHGPLGFGVGEVSSFPHCQRRRLRVATGGLMCMSTSRIGEFIPTSIVFYDIPSSGISF